MTCTVQQLWLLYLFGSSTYRDPGLPQEIIATVIGFDSSMSIIFTFERF